MINNSGHRDWIDIMLKLLPGVGAVIAGVFIPLAINSNSERNRSNQLYAQIVSEREKSDSDLRSKMFENLIQSFFNGDSAKKTNKQKLTLLRLLALNFHESFNFKPIFEELEPELTKNEKEKLKEIAREIIGKQEAMLSQVEEGMVYEKTLYEGDENGIMIPPDSQAAYRGHRLGIVVTEIGKEEERANLHVFDIAENNDNVDLKFKVTCYDMPFMDNTKLFNNTRFAVTLKETGTDSAGVNVVHLKIIFFPEAYMSSRDRPYLDEMLEKLRSSKEGA